MIVAETADGYRCITQPDHADLAGQFAERWGNETFDRPDPHAPLVIAAYAHDAGWWRYDQRPHLDGGSPVDFREMPAETWIDLYDEGIDAAVETDPYAGLLVSMHGAGLRNRRYGLSPAWPETPPEYEAFVDREEARQARLLEALRDGDSDEGGSDSDGSSGDSDGNDSDSDGNGGGDGDGGDSETGLSATDADVLSTLHESGRLEGDADSRLWAGYKLLQAWDTLSLAFCVTVSPPGYGEIGDVPTGAGGPDETLSIAPLGDGEFAIDPYPFDESPLVASVPTRSVAADAVDDPTALVRAYYDGGRSVETFTLRPAKS